MKYVIPLILVILLIRYLIRNKKKRVIRAEPQPEVLKQDPVCGAYVSQKRDLCLHTEDGAVYFCSKACMTRFKERAPS